MITSIFLALIFQVMNVLTFYLDPVTSLPFGMDTALVTVYSLVHTAVRIFPPLGTAMVFLLLGISVEFLYFTYRLTMRIIEIVAAIK